MKIDDRTLRWVAMGCSAALMTVGSALAQTTSGKATAAAPSHSATGGVAANGDARDEARGAVRDVNDAVAVIQRMEADASAAPLLPGAKGVFVVPKYGRAALGIGGRGGVGLLMVKHGSTWSDPAFYNFGGVSAGAQVGVEGGSFVLVLNNDKAVNAFTQRNNWALNADAGLTVVSWSKGGQASANKGDVTMWSNAKGLFAGVAVSLTDIKYDRDQTSAYYGRTVAVNDVINGNVSNPQTETLKQALAYSERRARGRAHRNGGQSGGRHRQHLDGDIDGRIDGQLDVQPGRCEQRRHRHGLVARLGRELDALMRRS